jgi:hypothetical protein
VHPNVDIIVYSILKAIVFHVLSRVVNHRPSLPGALRLPWALHPLWAMRLLSVHLSSERSDACFLFCYTSSNDVRVPRGHHFLRGRELSRGLKKALWRHMSNFWVSATTMKSSAKFHQSSLWSFLQCPPLNAAGISLKLYSGRDYIHFEQNKGGGGELMPGKTQATHLMYWTVTIKIIQENQIWMTFLITRQNL